MAHQHHAHGEHNQDGSLKDPVCGMTVSDGSSHRESFDGRVYYFCSNRCQSKFVADPARYTHQTSAGNPAPKAVPQAGTNEVSSSDTIYTCPMHPEVRQDHPGNCPKCGMTLEPLLPELEQDDNPELRDFQRRFWWTLPLTVIVTVLAMGGHRLKWFDMATQSWIELGLSLPIVLWAGWPFFTRGWRE